jgi:DNA-binding GntR family transcriptional regulator
MFLLVNKFSSIPLYSQLKNLIIEKIDKGEYAENTKIPSEQELCELYDISRPTVRQAIAELTNSGYLYKEKGKGTFVSKSKVSVDIKNYSGFTDSILDSLNPGQHNIISLKVISNSDKSQLDEIFNNPTGLAQKRIEYAEIVYLSTQNNEVLSLNTSYLPLVYFPEIIEDIKANKPSYDILKGKYPLLPARTKSTLEVVYTKQSEAQYLLVQPGQPLIKIENLLYSKSGQVVEYIISKYRADKCRLAFENVK